MVLVVRHGCYMVVFTILLSEEIVITFFSNTYRHLETGEVNPVSDVLSNCTDIL